jgi:magnesium chelatase subunit D
VVNEIALTLRDPLLRGLACAALNPGLRSVLMFDATPRSLQIAADTIAQFLRLATGRNVVLVTLGTTETEDDLWGRFTLKLQNEPFEWQAGLLTAEDDLRVVVIPDLTQLSLSAARACVALMGTEVAHLQRQGQHQVWKPNLCWVAGCATESVGMVSPHLLDRFALRLSGRMERSCDRTNAILTWLDQSDPESAQTSLSPEVQAQFEAALRCDSTVTKEGRDRVLDYFEEGLMRREIALMRLAIATAKLDGITQVGAKQVDRAAEMIGLQSIVLPSEAPTLPTPEIKESEPQPEIEEDIAEPSSPFDLAKDETESTIQEPVYQSDEVDFAEQPFTLPVLMQPYPEDIEPVQREAASLQLPMRRFQSAAKARGIVVGVEPATTPHDLAWVDTLLEAAKWQIIRRDLQPLESERRLSLILSPTDLRRYRRASVAEQLLVLVMDHTCLRDCNWRETLLPYLTWAYVERSSVCLVQVGAALSKMQATKLTQIHAEELRARKTIERSILVPRINAGLEAERGRATPLAHGLDLALHTLRHALQHGRSTVQHCRAVRLRRKRSLLTQPMQDYKTTIADR